MAQISPYLTFNGNCAEAMNFYKEVFGGELMMQTFGQAPMESSEECKDRIMHAQLTSGELILMASDSMPEHPITAGSNVTLSVQSKSKEEQEKYFNKLAESGQVTMPLADTFWGAYFGMLTDKFGMHWMFNTEHKQK
jgi:PhnB protein